MKIKTRNPARIPEYFADDSGQPCVRIRLANTAQHATLYADDLDHLLQGGLSRNWALYSNGHGLGHVKAKVPGDSPRVVARLICGAGAGQQVAYRDGNRRNLRRENLTVTEGGTARVDCAALLRQASESEASAQALVGVIA